MESLLLAGAFGYFSALRLRTYLQFYQQEEYDFRRLLIWWWQARAYDRWASVGVVVLLPFVWVQPAAVPLALAIWIFWRAKKEPDTTRQGKKPLILTPRATRLWVVSGLCCVPVILSLAIAIPHAPLAGLLATVFGIQIIPLALNTANSLLWPLQLYQNRRYLTEAVTLLKRLNPKVVSISGAFGKTSTKVFLGHILQAHAPTIVSPGSTNTSLGLARVIREQLQPHHQFFVAEMGAYQVGSIAKICALFPPDACATTAIGAAHYERFKSLEAVAKAEFEVLDATLQRGGPAVLSIDCIPEPLWRPRVQAAPHIRLVSTQKAFIRPGDYYLKMGKQTPKGLQLAIEHKGQLTAFQTKLFGTTMAPNLATAFALATELGVPKATSAAMLADVTAAPHRLAVRQEGHLTLIDDSYNSNPAGFATALEVLELLGKGRRKILITPGMVELGSLHEAEHRQIGLLAAAAADIVVAVTPARIPSFVAAVSEVQAKTGNGQLLQMNSFSQARAWLSAHSQANDVVLLENDLPDRYEARWAL